MIKNLFDNWRTTSVGLTAIITSVVHLVFAVIHGATDENTWTTHLLVILLGIGSILSGDAAKSTKDLKAIDVKVDQTAKAVLEDDTSILPNPTPKPPASEPPKP